MKLSSELETIRNSLWAFPGVTGVGWTGDSFRVYVKTNADGDSIPSSVEGLVFLLVCRETSKHNHLDPCLNISYAKIRPFHRRPT